MDASTQTNGTAQKAPTIPPSSTSAEPAHDSTTIPAHLDPSTYPRSETLADENIHLELTYSPLDTTSILARVNSPSAGANVLFLGTTRNTFDSLAVAQLSYTSYAPLALRTLRSIARSALAKHSGVIGISISHRLGTVPIGEASIAIAVSSAHRRAAWSAGEEILEECKEKAEIWKREEFVGQRPEEGEWRANRDRDGDGKVVDAKP
jgi:molybdopterin synthase catalytic subunit